jgi:transposase-like protein
MTAISAPEFTNEAKARAFLENQRWPDGVVCPFCGEQKPVAALPADGALGVGWYHCRDCRKKFTVRVGALYERSHIPLHKWLLATHLLCSSKKGMSAHQLSRLLEITYKSAWFMAHRIREGMKPSGKDAGPLGGAGKIVEANETYIGKSDGKRKGPGGTHKRAVMSLVERGGKIRSFKIGAASRDEMLPIMLKHIDRKSTLHTDGAQVYKFTGVTADHESVDHNKTYVRDGKSGKVHTNTLEGFFSVFKRGMVGTYQHCGEQHLDRYLAEFDFRQNTRSKFGIDDAARAKIALKGIEGKRLTYRRTNQA